MAEVLEKEELEKYTQAIEKGDFSFLENLSQEKMAALYAELNESGLNKLAEHLSPKQILDAEALVPAEGKDNFDKLCEMKLEHLSERGQEVLAAQGKNNIELATLVEQAPEIEKLSARATNKPETVAEVQKMMGEALAQYDAENGLTNVDAARLDANMQSIESHWDYDPFAPKAEGEKQDPEWEELHNMLDALDVRGQAKAFGREKLDETKQAEAKETLLEAAKLKAMQKLANKKDGVSAEDWDGSLKESLQEVLFEAYSADQMSKGNTNDKKIAQGFSKLVEAGSKGKKVQINRDSIAGVAAAVYMASNTYGERLGQLSSPTAEGVKKFAAKAKDLDAKWAKKYGENYKLAKNGLKQLGMSALGFAKGYALGEVAKLCGPVGMTALAAYRMGTSIKNMTNTYKQMKAQNKDLTLGKFLKSKEGLFGASAVALSAVSAVIPGMSGAETLGKAAQIMRYGQSLAGMGLALGPKIGAVLKSPKGQRKAAVVALGVAATGFLTSCLMRGGAEETTDLKTMAENSIADNAGLDLNNNGMPDYLEVQPVKEFSAVPEGAYGPEPNFDENDMSSVYGHNPNQAAFERGEFDAHNQAAEQQTEQTQAEQAAEQQVTDGKENAAHSETVSKENAAQPESKETAAHQSSPVENVSPNVAEPHSIDMVGVKMDYAIGNDGMINVTGELSLDKSHDAALTDKLFDGLTPNEKGEYSVPGEYGMVTGGSEMGIKSALAQYTLQDLKVQEAVYTDLTERQNMGIELSEGEQKFMQGHEADLKKWGMTHEDFGYMGDYAPHENTPENITVIEGDASKLGITPENQAASEQVQPQGQRNVEEDLLKEQITAEDVEKAAFEVKEERDAARAAVKAENLEKGIAGNQAAFRGDAAAAEASQDYINKQNEEATTPHPMHSKIEALRQEMMYNKACNEANEMGLTGLERNDYIRQEVREFMSKNDDKTYVAQELGGNEAKKNAYQDDINFGMGSPKGRS